MWNILPFPWKHPETGMTLNSCQSKWKTYRMVVVVYVLRVFSAVSSNEMGNLSFTFPPHVAYCKRLVSCWEQRGKFFEIVKSNWQPLLMENTAKLQTWKCIFFTKIHFNCASKYHHQFYIGSLNRLLEEKKLQRCKKRRKSQESERQQT